MTRRRPSTSSLPTAFSLLSAALCLLLDVPFRHRDTAVYAWVIPKSLGNVLLPSSPRASSGQQQEGLLSPLHISTAESLIIGTPTSTGRDGTNTGTGTNIDQRSSPDIAAAAASVPREKLQQIETPFDQWVQDVMAITAATLAGIMSPSSTAVEQKDMAQTAVEILRQPLPSGQNQIPVVDRVAKVRRSWLRVGRPCHT
jgi:hypothetical protein